MSRAAPTLVAKVRSDSLSLRPYSSATCAARLSRCRSCRVSNAARKRGTMLRKVSPCAAEQFVDRRNQRCRAQQDRRLRDAQNALQEITRHHLLIDTATGVTGQLGSQRLGLHSPHFGQHAQECSAQERHRRDLCRSLDVRGKQICVKILPLYDRLCQREQSLNHVFPILRRHRGNLGHGQASSLETPPQKVFQSLLTQTSIGGVTF